MVWYRATEQPWIPALTDITTTERIMMSIFSLVVIVVNQVYGLQGSKIQFKAEYFDSDDKGSWVNAYFIWL